MTEVKQGKLRSLFTDPANLFVVKIFLVYGAWKLGHIYLTQLEWWRNLVIFTGSIYASVTSSILNMMGQHTYSKGISIIYLDGLQRIIFVYEHCLAFPATLIFVSAIVLFNGSWKNKAWFIPLGILCIILINLIRLLFVCYVFENFSPTFYRINHSYVYVFVTYAFVFGMIVWWMKSFNTSKNGQVN